MKRLWSLALLPLFFGAGPADPPAADDDGEPLPPGALLRLGSARGRVVAQEFGQVSSLSFSPDGVHVRTITQAGSVQRWDAATGRLVREFSLEIPDLRRALSEYAVSPGGRLMAFWDGAQVSVWDLEQAKRLRQFRCEPCTLAFTPDSRTLVAMTQTVNPGTVYRWDLKTGELIDKPKAPANKDLEPPLSLTVAPDGKSLLVRCRTAKAGGEFIGVRDLTGAEVGRHALNRGPDFWVWPHAIAPDGANAIHGVKDRLSVRDTVTDKEKWGADLPRGKTCFAGFGGDGRHLAMVFGESHGMIRDTATGKQVAAWGSPDKAESEAAREWVARHIAVSGDGKRAAWIANENCLEVIDTSTGRRAWPPRGLTVPAFQMHLATDNRTLLVRTQKGDVAWFDLATGGEVRFLPLRRLPDGRLIIGPRHLIRTTWARDGVEIIDPLTMKPLNGITLPKDIYQAVPSADGKYFAHHTGSITSPIVIADAATGKEVRRFSLAATKADEIQAQFIENYSPDGRWLLLNDVKSRMILLHTETGQIRPLGDHTAFSIRSSSFSADGRMLAIADFDESVVLWETATGQKRGPAGPQTTKYEPVAFAPRGGILARVGETPSVLSLWDVYRGQEVNAFPHRQRSLTALAFAPDGRRLFTGGGDTTITVWDVEALLVRRLKVTPLDAAVLSRHAEALAGKDGERAFRAMQALLNDPERYLAWLREALRPVRAADAERVRGLIADLDSDSFETREAAGKALLRRSDLSEGQLRAAYKGKLSPEARRRVTELLERLQEDAHAWPPERLLALRGIELLEQIGTKEAVVLLKALAEGEAAAFLTREARGALERLETKKP